MNVNNNVRIQSTALNTKIPTNTPYETFTDNKPLWQTMAKCKHIHTQTNIRTYICNTHTNKTLTVLCVMSVIHIERHTVKWIRPDLRIGSCLIASPGYSIVYRVCYVWLCDDARTCTKDAKTNWRDRKNENKQTLTTVLTRCTTG